MKVGGKKKYFICPYCGKKCGNKGALMKHISAKHPNVEEKINDFGVINEEGKSLLEVAVDTFMNYVSLSREKFRSDSPIEKSRAVAEMIDDVARVLYKYFLRKK